MKRIISFLCIAAVLLSSVPFVAVSEDAVAEPYYSSDTLDLYFFADGECTVPISNGDEIPLFQTVFYRAECREGYALSGLSFKAADVSERSFSYTGDPEIHPECYLIGDFDSSEALTLSDASWMMKHIAGWTDSPSWTISANFKAADVDKSGSVNLSDVSALLKIIAGWGDPPGGVQTEFYVYDTEDWGFPYESDKQFFGDGASVEGAGCNLSEDSTAMTDTAVDESAAVDMTAEEFIAIIDGTAEVPEGEELVCRVSETVVLNGSGDYSGQRAGGVTLIGDVDMSYGIGGTLSSLKVLGDVDVSAYKVTLEGLCVFGSIFIDGASATVSDCRIVNGDYCAIWAFGDHVCIKDSYIEGEIEIDGDHTTVMNCYIDSSDSLSGAFIYDSDSIIIRENTFEGEIGGLGIEVCESRNVLVCLNEIKSSRQSVSFVDSDNCSVILNSMISMYTSLSSNVYAVDNSMGGRFVSRTGQYLIYDGNTFAEDGLDHSPVLDRVIKVNGDNLTDTSVRSDVGAEESVLPHTNKDLFVGMERRDTVTGGLSFTEYVAAEAESSDVVIIPPGAYSVDETLTLEGINGKKIYAYGVMEEFTDYPYGNRFVDCSDLDISGITVGYAKQSAGQVHVLRGAGSQLRVVTAAGYVNDYGVTDLDTFFLNTQESDVYKAGKLYSHTSVAYHTVRKMDDGTMSMVLDSDDTGITAGDVICCRLARGSYVTVQLSTCNDVHFRDMVTYGTADAICFTATGNSTRISIDRWQNTTRSAPEIDKDTYDRYAALEQEYGVDLEISVDAEGRYRGSIPRIGSIDATHINGSTEGITVTSSILENMCDDGSNHRGSSSRLHDVKVLDGGVTEIYYKNSLPEWYALHSDILSGLWCEPFEVGQNILAYTPDGRVLCDTEVLSASEFVETIYYTVDGLDKQFYTNVYKITVATEDVDMSAIFDGEGNPKYDLSDNHYRMDNKVVVDNLSRNSAGFTFDNVVVQNIRSRALCVKTTDATIKNCTFRNIGTGLLLYFESEWGESTVARDVLVKGCLFENTGYLYGDYGNVKYAPVAILGPGADLEGGVIPCRNITVEGCAFRNTANYYHIVVKNAADVAIRGNDFGYMYDHEYGEYAAPAASVLVDNSKNVEITDNTVPEGIDMKDWVTVKNSVGVSY